MPFPNQFASNISRDASFQGAQNIFPSRIRTSLILTAIALCLLATGFIQNTFAQNSYLVRNFNGKSAISLDLYLDGQRIESINFLKAGQSRIFKTPPSLTVGQHKLRVVETASESVTRLAGFEILFEPNVSDSATSKHWISDLLNQIRLFADYDVTVSSPNDRPWGVLVRANFNSNTPGPVLDHLVGAYDGNIVFSSNVAVGQNGAVTVNKTYPLAEVSQIIIYDDDGADFSLYYGSKDKTSRVRTYNLFSDVNPGDVIYESGGWNISQQSIQNHQVVTKFGSYELGYVYALYQKQGALSVESDVRKALTAAAKARNIPPQIIYGIAYQESGSTHRWQQFRKPSEGSWTEITPDGGIGLMQLTQGTALNGAAGAGALDRLARLGADVAFNIEAGADVLNDKWNTSQEVGNDDRQILENWYFAIRDYNGGDDYPPFVYKAIRSGGSGNANWEAVPISAPNPDDLSSSGEIRYTPTPAHKNPGYSGNAADIATIEAKFSGGIEQTKPAVNLLRLKWTITNICGIPLGGVTIAEATAVTRSRQVIVSGSPVPNGALLNAGAHQSFQFDFATDELASAAKCSIQYFTCGNGKYMGKRIPLNSNLPTARPPRLEAEHDPANSELVSFVLRPPAWLASPGMEGAYAGRLQNTSGHSVYLNEISFEMDDTEFDLDGLKFLVNTPAALGAGETWDGELFDAKVRLTTANGLYSGTAILLGGADINSGDVLGKQAFGIRVGPEPVGGLAIRLRQAADGEIFIEWQGGSPPYQVQTRESLSAGGWEDVGAPTTENIFSAPPGAGQPRFFRVVSQ